MLDIKTFDTFLPFLSLSISKDLCLTSSVSVWHNNEGTYSKQMIIMSPYIAFKVISESNEIDRQLIKDKKRKQQWRLYLQSNGVGWRGYINNAIQLETIVGGAVSYFSLGFLDC